MSLAAPGSSSGRRLALALALLVATVVGTKLVYLEFWLLNNDNYVTLSTFFSSHQHPEYVPAAQQLYAAMIKGCAPSNPGCVAGAGAVFGEQTYARPITAYFGSWVADPAVLSSDRAFLDGIAAATVAHVAVSTLLSIVLVAAFLIALPRQVGAVLATALALFGIVGYFLPEQTAWSRFQPLLGVGLGGAIAVLACAILAAVIVGTTARFDERLPPARRLAALCWRAAIGLLLVRIVASRWPVVRSAGAVAGSEVGLLIVVVALAGIITCVVAVRAAGTRLSARPGTIAVALVLLCGFVSIGENFFSTAFHIAARGSIFMLAAPVLVYAALRPNGRVLWLMPLLALFHVSIAELLFGCVAITELAAAVRRRSLSVALVLSAVLLAATAAFTGVASYNPVIPPAAASLMAVLAPVNLAGFLPAIAVFAVLGAALYVVWRLPDPCGDLLVRAVVLAAVLAAAGQLRYVLQSAEISIMDPAAYNFILLSYYLAPAVCAAGIFLVMFALSLRPAEGTVPGQVSRIEFDSRAWSLVLAGVLALVAARGGTGVTRPAVAAVVRGVTLTISPSAPIASIEPLAIEAAAANDRYVIGTSPGDAVSMVSLLKMKARSAVGLLKPADVTFVDSRRPPP